MPATSSRHTTSLNSGISYSIESQTVQPRLLRIGSTGNPHDQSLFEPKTLHCITNRGHVKQQARQRQSLSLHQASAQWVGHTKGLLEGMVHQTRAWCHPSLHTRLMLFTGCIHSIRNEPAPLTNPFGSNADTGSLGPSRKQLC